jgi:hypothetical protein
MDAEDIRDIFERPVIFKQEYDGMRTVPYFLRPFLFHDHSQFI